MPDAFDLDNEVEGLRGQIGRLKQVCAAAAVPVVMINVARILVIAL